jgi:glutamyl-tRNA synthetase
MKMEELIELFSLEKVSKSGAKFDLDKARWFNHQYLQLKSNHELAEEFHKQLIEKGINTTFEKVERVVALVKERVHFIQDFWAQSSFLFVQPESYNPDVIKKRWKEDTPKHLNMISNMIQETKPFDKVKAHDNVMAYIQDNQINMGQIMNCLRLSLVGDSKGPDLFEIIDFLGTEEVSQRISKAIQVIG